MAGKKRSREQGKSIPHTKSDAKSVIKTSNSTAHKTKPMKSNVGLTSENKLEDWALSLAKASMGTSAASMPSKKERKERRAAKQARRSAKLAQSQKIAEAQGPHESPTLLPPLRSDDNTNMRTRSNDETSSKRSLKKLASIMKSLRSVGSDATTIVKSKSLKKPYTFGACNVKKMRRSWDETSIQPRSSDYGGIGLARQSIYIGFDDLSFFPKLRLEFQEHIPGFFGRQRTKSMKRQLDGNMLWRQLEQKKKQDVSINGKKLSQMTPDERVMALIESGAL